MVIPGAGAFSTVKEMTLVQTESLSKHFRLSGSRRIIKAVDKVTMAVGQGEVVGLIGPSGCGKSTLARLLLRLIEPTSGHVIFEGCDLIKLDGPRMRKLRRRMQIIFQDPALDPRMPMIKQVIEPLRIHFPDESYAHHREVAEDLLNEVGLRPAHMVSYPHELSLGQCQRASVARALSLSPDFVVADEPVSALDPVTAVQVIDLLQRLQQQRRMAVLLISHDIRLARRMSRRILVMGAGRIVDEGPTEVVFEKHTNQRSHSVFHHASF